MQTFIDRMPLLTATSAFGLFIYLSHARTVVRECCKGDDESQWERGKFDPPPPKNPLSYHNISYQGFLVRPLLREPRPQVHYKSQPDATAQRETQKSTNVKSLTDGHQNLCR